MFTKGLELRSQCVKEKSGNSAAKVAATQTKLCVAFSGDIRSWGLMRVVTLLFIAALPAYASPTFPLKVSADHRYLVDQNNVPFFMLGDSSAQTFFSNLSTTDAGSVMADRASYGFNALWVHITISTAGPLYGRSNLSTYDGIAPFTGTCCGGTYDLSTPNSAYFARIDAMVQAAATLNMVVFLDIFENYSDLSVYEANGNTAVYNYGAYLGNRYKNFPNIVWIMGNDFQTWTTGLPNGTGSSSQAATDNGLAQAVMQGVLSADTNHLMTEELNYAVSGSTDDTLISPLASIYSSYTYYPTYGEVLAQYNASTVAPVIMIEGYYENNSYSNQTPASLNALGFRKQAYWTALSGGLGGFFHGNQSELPLVTPISGWQSSLDTTTATQMKYFAAFIDSFSWWNLAPDQKHVVVTAGYGTPTGVESGGGNGTGRIDTDAFVTTSYSSDGTLALAYDPSGTTLTVAMTKFGGSVTARWYDPSSNTYTAISGSPFANTGTHNFATPGNNSGGSTDWVLVLQSTSSAASPPAPPTGLTAIVN